MSKSECFTFYTVQIEFKNYIIDQRGGGHGTKYFK